MRGASAKKACPMLKEAEGSQRVGHVPGDHVTVALEFSNPFHSLEGIAWLHLVVFII
jgi:hypothetical protein